MKKNCVSNFESLKSICSARAFLVKVFNRESTKSAVFAGGGVRFRFHLNARDKHPACSFVDGVATTLWTGVTVSTILVKI
jgi:hypothetical protein